MQRPLPGLTEHFGVFTAAMAYASGWTPDALEHAVRRERIVRVTRGVFVPSDAWAGTGIEAGKRRLVIRAVAATMAVNGGVASHTSAALLAGLPVWELPDRPCITLPPRKTGDAGCAHLHRATLPVAHVLASPAARRTRTARTILDTAREHGIEDAVVVGDCALGRRMTDVERLARIAEFCRGWPGMRRARRVLAMLDPRSESPLESVSRIRLPAAGVPMPEPQPEICGRDGVLLGRPDFYWDEPGVAGEVDGRDKYRLTPDEVIWREKRRQEQMEDLGLVFVRWARADLEDMPRLVARIETAFARGARRPRIERGSIARRTPRFAPRNWSMERLEH